jgi:transposase-like protein
LDRARLGAGDGPVRRSKSQVSKLCKDIDERVNAFLDRRIKGEWPYLRLDAAYLKVCDAGCIVSAAAITAVRRSRSGF